MRKHSHLKIISSAIIITVVFALTTCGEESSDHGMVWIPSGDFMMGSSSGESLPNNPPPAEPGRDLHETRHKVTLTQGFYMSRYLITEEQFAATMGYTSKYFNGGGSRLPANGVSWYEAIVFCNRLSIQEGLEPVYEMEFGGVYYTNPEVWINYTDPINKEIPKSAHTTWDALKMRGPYPNEPNGYRLPTEAEWEYACRAGTTTAYNTGSNITTEQANYGKPSDGSEGTTTRVGSYLPNAWGLYDMHGNVYEWCWDWYSGSFANSAVENPAGQSSGSTRIIRGGSWLLPLSYVSQLRSAYRIGADPAKLPPPNEQTGLGFRVVRR